MLVVKLELHKGGSSRPENVVPLGTLLIDNVGVSDEGRRGNYRVRVYKKGDDLVAVRYGAKPIREDFVMSHARLSSPVWSLVAKALRVLGYRS